MRLQLGSGQLAADRVEFDGNFQTVFARGSVRLSRTGQVFQASALRYNLNQNEGELDDVYGVIDLDAMQGIFQVAEPSSAQQLSPDDKLKTAVQEPAPMACPPLLPPVPDWHPQPWAVTAWAVRMDGIRRHVLLNGTMRPEAVLGIGLQKRSSAPLWPWNSKQTCSVTSRNNSREESSIRTSPMRIFPPRVSEGTAGIGARLWVQPWLSFSVVEGISYNTDYSLYEKTFRENYTKLLNYLGFEVEAAVSSDVSLVGRIHHRSGAFGTYSGVTEGSNAYLLGLRYRWGRDLPEPVGTSMVPPLGCPDPKRSQRVNPTSLSERLESIALGDGGEAIQHIPPSQAPTASPLSAAEQQRRRSQAIAGIDQRIDDVDFQGTLSIERRSGVPVRRLNSSVRDENRFGVVRVPQLKRLGSTQLINGTISRWRVQAARVQITPNGWRADRMGFSNDPFTPAQTRIDAEDVVARDQPNGDLLISARRNRLIVEERLPVPVSRRQLIQKEEEVENRWVFGVDNDDRDGLFVGRNLKPITFGTDTELSLQPQVMVQRAVDGGSDVDPGDLFGLEAKLVGRYDNMKVRGSGYQQFQRRRLPRQQPLLGEHRAQF